MSFNSQLVHAGFLRSVLKYPDRPALLLDEVEWTYGELDEAARCWAAALIEACDGPPRSVGVFGYQSPESYAGLLAGLYAGATVVPLNWAFPLVRTAAMLQRAQPDVLIVDEGAARQLHEAVAGLPRAPAVLAPLLHQAIAGDLPGKRVMFRPDVAACGRLGALTDSDPSGVAHLFFAPGGPGQINGVPLTHRNVSRLLRVTAGRYRFGSSDRFAQTIDQVLALGMAGLLAAWQAGGCLVPLKPLEILSPFQVVREREISIYMSVASMAESLYQKDTLTPGSLTSLRWSLFGGEPMTLATARAWHLAAPRSAVENLYGRTEISGPFMAHRWDKENSPALCVNGLLPLGKPHDGLDVMVLDDDGVQVLEGESGEICVSGHQVFEGYWNAPRKSAESLFSRDNGSDAPSTWYRTGDEGVALEGGEYAYLGRMDRPARTAGRHVEQGREVG